MNKLKAVSDADVGAMYGLGYAIAEDGCSQMYYMLRIVQGRLAETIGDVKTIDGSDSASSSDRKMRIFGFYFPSDSITMRYG